METIGERRTAAKRRPARPHGVARPEPVAGHAVSPYVEAPVAALISLAMRALPVQPMVAELPALRTQQLEAGPRRDLAAPS